MKDEIRHEKPVEVNIQLTHREAQALAQLVKRLGFSDCRGLATSDIGQGQQVLILAVRGDEQQ
ncbi:TPA: hypothetical protein KL480_003926 [Escherichia coli]|nr:hypothetical protein [Escherichia coli]